jgi:glycosyltransferase involved in cell wall biosynthesis
MNFYIIIPAHNEEDSIALTLDSLINQTLLPKKVVIVNDNSTDQTQSIVDTYVKQHDWLDVITITSSNQHIPGYKVVNAFYKGFENLDDHYDIICKFDADILLPNDYLERIKLLFESHTHVGIAGGLAYIKKDNTWIYENISDKNHVRGPIKAYRKSCFKQIGGLKPSIGWDTLDTLLAKYHGWTVAVDRDLHVKHLKPTGLTYTKNSKYLQGEALYKMRYRFSLTLITALKMALNKQSFVVFGNYMQGYFKAKRSKKEFLVTEEEGRFIRSLRWKGIWNKLT